MRLFVLFNCLWCCGALLFSQNADFCKELSAINKLVSQQHFKPKSLNDSLSQGVWHLFIKALDERQRYFRQSDIDLFKADQFKLDDYISNGSCDFISPYAELLDKRLQDSKDFIKAIANKELDYSGKDSLHYRATQDISYYANEEAVKAYWNKKVRYEILAKLIETDSSKSFLKSNFKQLEKDLKRKVIENEICIINELQQRKGSVNAFVKQAFLNAFLNYQDPNSGYFSRSDKQLFEQSVANSQASFGISTEKKSNGDIVIAYIVPGSAAYKHGGIEVNDVILSLQNNQEILETFCTSNERITGFINDSEQDEITFRLKKKNGAISKVRLKKTLLEIEQNSITGYVLNGDSKIGYIAIPSFYTDLESTTGLGVANDVAKQIYKLQKEGIEGLILDLSFNGGGSMKEAVELSGLFIDRGPVTISKYTNGEVYTLRDPNRGQLFKAPVVVLVNQFSASASELFAAALQDYNRAIIMGNITHGKATSQQMMPISADSNSNFIKLTTGKFFRVTGESHQTYGIEPDILLPNSYKGYKTQARHLPYPMDNTATKVIVNHRPQAALDLETYRINSQKRVDANTSFDALDTFGTLLDEQYINRVGKFPLTLDFLYSDFKRYHEAWKTYDNSLSEIPNVFSIENTSSTASILSYNDDDALSNKRQREALIKDLYVHEAYHTLIEILNK